MHSSADNKRRRSSFSPERGPSKKKQRSAEADSEPDVNVNRSRQRRNQEKRSARSVVERLQNECHADSDAGPTFEDLYARARGQQLPAEEILLNVKAISW